MIVSDDQFEEYSKFLECHTFLAPVIDQLSILIEENVLLKYYMNSTGVELPTKIYYGTQVCLLSQTQLLALAQWVKLQQTESALI